MDSDSITELNDLPPPLPAIEAPLVREPRAGWPSLPKLLRWLGAVTLLSSALTFLVSNMLHTYEILRYAEFLGLTLLLSGCGWFCISRWKDDKGARTFFALAAAILPAHFAQLGAMTYATYNREESFDGLRRAFEFSALEPLVLLSVLGVALAVLIPLTYVGFASMARKQAGKLTLVYVLANATLLFTVRDPNLVAALGFVMLAGLLWIDRRYFATQSRMRTWDGIAMRSLLFAPFGLLIGRNLVLHGNQSELLYSLLFTTLACVFYIGLPRCVKEEPAKCFLRLLALGPGLSAWYFFATGMGWGSDSLYAPQLVLPWAAIAGVMSCRLGPMMKAVQRNAALAAVLSTIFDLVAGGALMPSLISSLVAVGTALVVILIGYGQRERWVFRIGLVGLSFGLLYHLRYAVDLYRGPWLWVSLAATGVLVLLSSSYLERHGRGGLNAIKALHRKVSGWK